MTHVGNLPRLSSSRGKAPTSIMWYDRGPQPDARHGRSLISDLTKSFNEFVKIHERALKTSKSEHQRESNIARIRVKACRSLIWRQKSYFPIDVQTNFDTVTGHISGELEHRLSFPDLPGSSADVSRSNASNSGVFLDASSLPPGSKKSASVTLPISKKDA